MGACKVTRLDLIKVNFSQSTFIIFLNGSWIIYIIVIFSRSTFIILRYGCFIAVFRTLTDLLYLELKANDTK